MAKDEGGKEILPTVHEGVEKPKEDPEGIWTLEIYRSVCGKQTLTETITSNRLTELFEYGKAITNGVESTFNLRPDAVKMESARKRAEESYEDYGG